MEKLGHVILNGDKKVMFSAPHAVEQTRNDAIKYAEPDTGEIAKCLNALGYPVIIKTENMHDDANYDIDCAYKNQLTDYIKQHNIIALIDLHELSPKREQLICLGTGGEDCPNLLGNHEKETQLKDHFKKYFDVVTINDPFSAKGEGTISRYISLNLNIPCVQIEMNSKLFIDNMVSPQQMADIMAKATHIMENK